MHIDLANLRRCRDILSGASEDVLSEATLGAIHAKRYGFRLKIE